MKKSVIILLILAAGAGVLWWKHQSDPAAGPDIQTAAADKGAVRHVVSTSGSVRALVTVEVGSQISGQVTSLAVDYNSEVKEGDVIAEIDPRSYQTQLREAEAAVAIAEANLGLQQASLAKAEANRDNAQSLHDRTVTLRNRGNATQAALDDAVAGLRVSEADVTIAEAQLSTAEATLEQRRASEDSARIDLERTTIRSPIDGVVVDRSVSVGQTVAASLSAPTLFTIAQDLRQVQIDAAVDEADIGQVHADAPVFFTVDAYPEKRFEGVIDQIRLAPTADQNVVTYTVVVSAENPEKLLLPGMTANVEIVTGEREDVLRVPNEALASAPARIWPR
jgi:HlyD family secretion protein